MPRRCAVRTPRPAGRPCRGSPSSAGAVASRPSAGPTTTPPQVSLLGGRWDGRDPGGGSPIIRLVRAPCLYKRPPAGNSPMRRGEHRLTPEGIPPRGAWVFAPVRCTHCSEGWTTRASARWHIRGQTGSPIGSVLSSDPGCRAAHGAGRSGATCTTIRAFVGATASLPTHSPKACHGPRVHGSDATRGAGRGGPARSPARRPGCGRRRRAWR